MLGKVALDAPHSIREKVAKDLSTRMTAVATPKRFIFIAPKARQGEHPGGQGTATFTALEYARDMGYMLNIVDTTQSSFPVPPFFKRLTRGIKRLAELARLLGGGEVAGVVIFASSGFSFFERITCSLLCRIFGVRDLFFQRSGFFIDEVASSPWRRMVVRHLLKLPYRIGAQGKNAAEFYRSLGVEPERIAVIRNWLPESVPMQRMPRAYVPGELLHFIFVGWLVREKGVLELLDAIESVRRQFRFRVTFVGGGTLVRAIETRIEQGGWTGDVLVTGWKRPDEVLQILDKADVFVLPSYAEGFPNALLEAMARGLPAICSDVGGISDSLHHATNGFLIPPRNSQALADTMSRYLMDTSLIQSQSTETMKIVAENHDRAANCNLLFSSLLTS